MTTQGTFGVNVFSNIFVLHVHAPCRDLNKCRSNSNVSSHMSRDRHKALEVFFKIIFVNDKTYC